MEFFHYDPYAQALTKLQRRHARDLRDVRHMSRDGLIHADQLLKLFESIELKLIRYPAIDARTFRGAVLRFCRSAVPDREDR